MDWLWWVGSILFVMIVGVVAFYLLTWIARVKDEFRAAQPDLRITNVSAITSGHVLTLLPEIENLGGGMGLDCVLHMGGWDGSFAVMKVHPRRSRPHKHVASIVLGPDAAIRAKPLSNGYLRLRYLDRWGHKYDRWYPVTQSKRPNSALFDVQIDLDHPDVNEPALSFWEMRALLRALDLPQESSPA